MFGETSVSMVGWLNENAYRAFPFAEDSNLACTDGTTVPNWLVLDAKAIVLPHADAPSGDVRVALTKYMVTRSTDDIALVMVWFSVFINGTESVGGSSYALVESGKVSHGRISIGDGISDPVMSVSFFLGAPASVASVDQSLFGTHTLMVPAAILPSRCIVRPEGFGIDGLYGNLGFGAAGMVHLRDGYNTSLRIVGGKVELTVSRSGGLGYECPEDKSCDAIYFINGQRADTNGNFSIVGGDGVQVSTGPSTVYITTTSLVDSYAKPR